MNVVTEEEVLKSRKDLRRDIELSFSMFKDQATKSSIDDSFTDEITRNKFKMRQTRTEPTKKPQFTQITSELLNDDLFAVEEEIRDLPVEVLPKWENFVFKVNPDESQFHSCS